VNENLVRDQGQNFMSTFFNEVCTILGVKHINTTAYHPQANGAAERFHRTMNRALGFYVNTSGSITVFLNVVPSSTEYGHGLLPLLSATWAGDGRAQYPQSPGNVVARSGDWRKLAG
jgi:transposase InsO family protein